MALSPTERKMLLEMIWAKKHKDYKMGRGGDRKILHYSPVYGTVLSPLSSLTDDEIMNEFFDRPRGPGA